MLKSGFLPMQDWTEIINSMSEVITIHDRDFNIIYANTAAINMLRLPSIKHNNVKCFYYYHGTESPPENCVSCRSLKTKRPSTVEMFEPHLQRFIEIIAIPRLNGRRKVIGLIHIVRDITRRRKVEAALEDRVLANIKTNIRPYIRKLKDITKVPEHLNYVNILEANLNTIISSFTLKASSKHFNLTPAEIHVSNLLREGRQSKEIAEILNISFETVNCHRQNIRKKFGLSNSKVNLRSFLLSLSD